MTRSTVVIPIGLAIVSAAYVLSLSPEPLEIPCHVLEVKSETTAICKWGRNKPRDFNCDTLSVVEGSGNDEILCERSGRDYIIHRVDWNYEEAERAEIDDPSFDYLRNSDFRK